MKEKKLKPTKRRKQATHTNINADIIYGLHAVQAALDVPVTRIIEIWLAEERDDERVQTVLETASQQGVHVHKAERETIDKLAPDVQHQGCVARCKPLKSWDEQGLFKLLDEQSSPPFLLLLDGVQDPHNLGACLRTAEAVGVTAVVAPKDRASGLTATAIKISSGAAERLPFVQVTNLSRFMRDLQQRGIWIVGTSGDATTGLFDAEFKGSIALVLGAEGKGIRRLTRSHCDEVIYIPMHKNTESLNVSVAAGVCLYEVYRQRSLLL